MNVSKDVTNVFAGIRYRSQVAKGWTVFAQGDIGAGTSDLTWAATLYASYQVGRNTSVLAGWRWLDYRISDSSIDMDMRMSGPLIALNFSW